MPVSSPLPSNLPKECAKAAQIFSSFSSIIPSEILRNARGFAILTIAKAGFLFSARAGSGLVVVKLPNGSWSGPSAIGTGGLGVGGQLGAELSEFVIILNSKAAVQSFMTAGSINLGGNLSVAVGPIGRNAEASGSLTKRATMYSYSRTRGLFGGASLEGSVILERSDANIKAYSSSGDYLPEEITSRNILSGQIATPGWANILIQSIERRVGTLFSDTWIDDVSSDVDEQGRNRGYSFGSEYASLGNSTGASGKWDRGSSSPRDRLDRLQLEDREWGEQDQDQYDDDDRGEARSSSARAGASSSATAAGRLRGYSFGSFRKSKSGASTPTKRAAMGRERAYSAAVPGSRFCEDDQDDMYSREQYDDDAADYVDFSSSSRPRPQRSPSRASDDIPPPSPSSTTSSASRAQRLTDFMKRPVLPARKSTSAIDRFNDGRTSPTMQRSSPLTGGGGGRTRSGTLASSIGRNSRGRLEHSGRYSSDGEDEPTGLREDKASPFADRFGEVEHRFSDNEENDYDNASPAGGRRRGGSTSREVATTRGARSGSAGMASTASGLLSSLSRPKLGSRKSSGTGGAAAIAAASAVSATTSAVKGVFKARPGMSKRSATAPAFGRRGEIEDDWDAAAYRRRQRGGYGDEFDDNNEEQKYGRFEGGGSNEDLEDILVDTRRRDQDRSDDNTDSSDEEGGGHRQIRIQRPDNPFAESSTSSSKRQNGRKNSSNGADGEGLFSSSRENRDIITSLDEADEADLHLSGSSFDSKNLARPTHRLESQSKSRSSRRPGGLDHSATDDDDASSIRSLDSSKGETTFGVRGIKSKSPAAAGQVFGGSSNIEQQEADFLSQLEPGPRFLATDTRLSSYSRESKKEYRIAVFDFEGGEEADLPFRSGEVLEVLSKEDPEWYTARLGMREGIIPVNRTKPYHP